ncbi:N-acetylglucosamine kinase-like BadF-type ATPase [Nakamurella sp. UYEF19]
MSSDGTVVSSTSLSSASFDGRDHDVLTRLLDSGISAVCSQADVLAEDIEYAFFGLPAYGEVSSVVPVLDRIPLQLLHHRRYTCDNDMVCGWAGSLGTAEGINVISGTGSMAFGVHRGRRARAGGWGELFGDEGSAHWIAIRGLAAFARMSDGRVARGPLHDLLRERLGLVDDIEAIHVVVNRWGARRSEVAALSAVVDRAAAAGDAVARQILTAAAAELVLVVRACRRALQVAADEAVPVSYSGGVFSADLVRDGFTLGMRRLGGYEVRAPLFTPVVGAALQAAALAGASLAPDAMRRLRAGAGLAQPEVGEQAAHRT